MPSTTTTTELGILVDRGKELAICLNNLKEGRVEENADIVGKVKKIVTSVLNSIENTQTNTYYPKESLENLVKKIQQTLEQFIKHDHNSKSGYKDLIKLVNDFRYHGKAVVPASKIESAVAESLPGISHSDEPGIDCSAIDMLDKDDYRCLRCFLLFPIEAEIKKREIFHCWIAMDRAGLVDREDLLAKFVALGLIKRVVQNNKVLSMYKMPASVHARLKGRPTNEPSLDKNEGSWSILFQDKQSNGIRIGPKKLSPMQKMMTMKPSFSLKEQPVEPSFENVHEVNIESTKNPVDKEVPEALLNINQATLNYQRFKTISKMSKLKVVHLGSWQQASKKYIVIEDVDAFKYLKNLTKLKFLSFAGVSGLVKLPKCVYELEKLKVLDLRGCNNLEQLEAGIKSLSELTHLDLSGCYLLDHVPFGITHLTKLEVLKGFVINVKPPKSKQSWSYNGKENTFRASNPCPFNELSKLKHLRKLTIITRKVDFPTSLDLPTFCELGSLECLRITWVGHSSAAEPTEGDFEGTFPATLKKLELQAAPDHTASRMLHLVSQGLQKGGLEKLYIKGGCLKELKHSFPQPKEVHLRYLPKLHIDWGNFVNLFPNLERLEVLDCPKLNLFPYDKDGVWEKTSKMPNMKD